MEMIFIKEMKWQKKCAACGKPIEKGQQGWWNKSERNKNYHVNCYKLEEKEPNTAKNYNTFSKKILSPEGEAKRVTTNVQADDPSIIVAKRLKKAREMVDTEFPNAVGYSDYLNMVSEICHQLFSESAINKIQSAKEKNIADVKAR